MIQYGKKITLFLVDGNADGIVTAELSNWNGKAIKLPRVSVASCNREDIEGVGVYFLFSEDDNGERAVYIGEAENIKKRLLQHIVNSAENFWPTAVMFTGAALNKTCIRYLENKLVILAKETEQYKVLTKTTYQNTVISEADEAAMLEFIDNIKIIINALGFNVLEKTRKCINTTQDDNDKKNNEITEIFYIEKTDDSISAQGMLNTNGFLVLEGSKVCRNIKPSFEKGQPGYYKSRKDLEERKIIDNSYLFTKDYLFKREKC